MTIRTITDRSIWLIVKEQHAPTTNHSNHDTTISHGRSCIPTISHYIISAKTLKNWCGKHPHLPIPICLSTMSFPWFLSLGSQDGIFLPNMLAAFSYGVGLTIAVTFILLLRISSFVDPLNKNLKAPACPGDGWFRVLGCASHLINGYKCINGFLSIYQTYFIPYIRDIPWI